MTRRQGDDLATPAPVPHSRWLVRENVNRLTASHAKAAEAISALHAAADIHRARGRGTRRLRTKLRQRVAMRRDWPQVIWFCLVLLGVTLHMGWISARLVARLVPAPGYVAVLPIRFKAPGDHVMPCQEFCGIGHQGMWGKVKVVDKTAFLNMTAAKRRLSCVD